MDGSWAQLRRQVLQSGAPDDRLASQLRGFGPVGILALLVILFSGNWFLGNFGGMGLAVPVGGILALLWVRFSRTPWRAIGYVRPRSWLLTVAVGILFGVAFKFVMKAVVMPLLGADPINRAYHFLAGNHAALPFAVWLMLVAGFGEETVFRGFLFERFGQLFGSSLRAKALTVLITAAGFGLAHYLSQGLTGAEQATIVGLVYGVIFAKTGQIFMLMFAHAAFDLTALVIIFCDLEYRVAHLVFG